MGRGGAMGSRLSRYVPISQIFVSASEGVGLKPALKLARQAHSATGPDRRCRAASSAFGSGRGCHQAGAINISAGGKPGTGRDRRQRLSQAVGVGRADQLPSRAGVPIFCDSSCSLGINAKRPGALRSRLP